MNNRRMITSVFGFIFCILLLGTGLWLLITRVESSIQSPAIEYVNSLNFGEMTMGIISSREVVFKNSGGIPLQVYNIFTSCSCSGFEEFDPINNSYQTVTEFEVAANQSRTFRVRLVARAQIGVEKSESIRFLTNVHSHPEGNIELHYRTTSAGFYTVPNGVDLGTMLVGTHKNATINVYDDAQKPRSIKSVTAEPAIFTARIIEPQLDKTQQPNGKQIGTIKVSCKAISPGDYTGYIQIQPDDGRSFPTRVDIRVMVKDSVEIFPNIVRNQADDKIILSVRSSQPSITEVKLKNKPAWVKSFTVKGNERTRFIEIETNDLVVEETLKVEIVTSEGSFEKMVTFLR